MVDAMEGKVILKIQANKVLIRKIEISLEKVEEKLIEREEESEVDLISNMEFPSFEDRENPEYLEDREEKFVREMKDFKREMEGIEKEWKEKMEKIEKRKIDWK